MIVTVHTVTPTPGQSVWTAEGTDLETGDTITFGGDWRAMEPLVLAVEEQGEVDAEIEPWQILSRTPKEA